MKLIRLILIILATILSSYSFGAVRSGQFDYYFRLLNSKSATQLVTIGDSYIQRDSILPALSAYSIVVGRWVGKEKGVNREQALKAYNCSGIIYTLLADYQHAYACYTKALEISQSDHERRMVQNNIASLYYIFEDYDAALKLETELFETNCRLREYDKMSSALLNIISIYAGMQQYAQTTPYINKYLSFHWDTPNNRWLYTHAQVQGILRVKDNDLKGAFDHFRQSLLLAGNLPETSAKGQKSSDESLPRVPSIIESYSYMADVKAMMHDYPQAIAYADTMLSIAQRHKYTNEEMRAQKSLSRYYELNGNLSQALECYKAYVKLKNGTVDASSYGKIKDMEYIRKIDNYVKENAHLAQQRSARTLLLSIAVIFLTVLSALLCILYKKNKTLSHQNRELYLRSQDYLQSLDEQKRMRHQILNSQAHDGDCGKYTSSHLDDEMKDRLMLRIREKVEDVNIIADEDFSLKKLAELTDSNPKYVSQVINECTGKNFATFLGEQRIAEICKRMTDTEDYGQLTVEAIAASVGIKSYSTFYRLFKKCTGLTPSQYMRIRQEVAAR